MYYADGGNILYGMAWPHNQYSKLPIDRDYKSELLGIIYSAWKGF